MTSPPPETHEPAPAAMTSRALRRRSGVVGVLAVLVLSAAYVLGPPPPHGGPGDVIGWDKLGHLFGFTVMTAVWALSWRRGWLRAGVPLAAALVLESAHALQPERMLSAADVAANLLGVALGLAVATLVERRAGASDPS